MLKNIGTPALVLKLGRWLCICMASKRMDEGLKARIRPLVFAGYACWCDRPDTD